MKHLALSLLALCSFQALAQVATTSELDPETLAKFEASIRAQTAGMVKTDVVTGTSPDFDMIGENYVLKLGSANSKTKETVLRVDGDAVYTLVENFENGEATPSREVKRESITQLVEEISNPIPNASISVSGNALTVNFSDVYDSQLGVNDYVFSMTVNATATVDLNDIRCSMKSSTQDFSKLVRKGVTVSSLKTATATKTVCGPSLSRDELRAIDLSSIRLCDETTGDEETNNCLEDQDLSYLVK